MINRILLAALSSGSGKTFLTCGLLKALKNRKISTRAYKCGPDYIDPMFHKRVLGIPGGNLDTWFSRPEDIRARLMREVEPGEIAVIEGVMGYYDGLGGVSTQASSYDVAKATNTPVILILDGKGVSLSIVSAAKGICQYKEDSRIAGVIINRMNPALGEKLRPAFKEQGIELLGCVPDCPQWKWDSRHLGLVMPKEQENINEILNELAGCMEQYVNIDRILEISSKALDMEEILKPEKVVFIEKEHVNIGVAMDLAFCFYYQENLDFLESLGARLQFFSPLSDKALPENVCGLLLGGGYPELYADRLWKNTSMRQAILKAAQNGMPISGECGGFLYLQEQLEGGDGRIYPMTGVLPGTSVRKEKLGRFGYIKLTAKRNAGWVKEGDQIKGHEFHYWDSDCCGDVFHSKKPVGDRQWDCIQSRYCVVAGFPHLYYPSNPSYGKGFVDACRRWKESQNK